MNVLATPLEHLRFQRYSAAAEIGTYLQALTAAAGPYATLHRIGRSAGGRPLFALGCRGGEQGARDRLRVLMTGSQHGASEAAGGEALLMLARDLLLGDLQHLLDDLELLIVPDANPDGRDLDSNRNAHSVNLNRDFVLLSQPESGALDALVLKFAPHLVLDAHESASYKRYTLGREGYLTSFEAQFDVLNAPAIPAVLRDLASATLLPGLLAAVEAKGLPAQRYIREITSVAKPVTHGGLTIRKFRNKSGLRGALSVLLETPMEPTAGVYPTYRNVGVRVEKQLLCQRTFLGVAVHYRHAIAQAVAAAAHLRPAETLPLNGSYGPVPDAPPLAIPLRRRDTFQQIEVAFADHRAVRVHDLVTLPAAYAIARHTAAFAALLARHQIPFETLVEPWRVRTERDVVAPAPDVEEPHTVIATEEGSITLPPGSLRVPVTQVSGRLLPLLLDPRSQSSVFRYTTFAQLLEPDRPCFIARCFGA